MPWFRKSAGLSSALRSLLPAQGTTPAVTDITRQSPSPGIAACPQPECFADATLAARHGRPFSDLIEIARDLAAAQMSVKRISGFLG
jgi:hypothetical protein